MVLFAARIVSCRPGAVATVAAGGGPRKSGPAPDSGGVRLRGWLSVGSGGKLRGRLRTRVGWEGERRASHHWSNHTIGPITPLAQSHHWPNHTIGPIRGDKRKRDSLTLTKYIIQACEKEDRYRVRMPQYINVSLYFPIISPLATPHGDWSGATESQEVIYLPTVAFSVHLTNFGRPRRK